MLKDEEKKLIRQNMQIGFGCTRRTIKRHNNSQVAWDAKWVPKSDTPANTRNQPMHNEESVLYIITKFIFRATHI